MSSDMGSVPDPKR